ncbi:hypothetical protein MKEN_00288600 [Mycena kentingensis (nom. inval.)]|nr:hypothetical protein MKEN_00288600 [Mycena kentingensis (nom. inval.)]
MTRTARSSSLRSMLKDRSENKTGVSGALRKNGGGAHNWGSLENERDLAFAGIDDGAAELEEEREDPESLDGSSDSGSDELTTFKKAQAPLSPTTEADIALARKFRTNALKAGADLSAIARTSVAMSSSPPKETAL